MGNNNGYKKYTSVNYNTEGTTISGMYNVLAGGGNSNYMLRHQQDDRELRLLPHEAAGGTAVRPRGRIRQQKENQKAQARGTRANRAGDAPVRRRGEDL